MVSLGHGSRWCWLVQTTEISEAPFQLGEHACIPNAYSVTISTREGSSLKESICQHEGSYKTLVVAVCPFILATDDTLVEQQVTGKARRRKASSVILSPTNSICTTLGLNLGICFENMAINHLSYGTALQNTKIIPLKLISLVLGVCISVLIKKMAGYTVLQL